MNDNADNDPRIHAIPDIHGHAKGEHKAFSDERPIPLSARMLFLWFYHACRRGWPRFLMVTDHMNYLTFEDPAAINLVRRALKLAQAGDLYGAAETASVEVGHAAVVSEGLRRGMRYSIGAEVDNDPRSRPDAQNIVDAMKPDGMIRSVHFLTIDHPTHGPNWNWPFDNPEFADVYDIVGTARTWDVYMTTLLDAVERLPGNIVGHFYVPALFGHWPDDATLETYEDQIVAACAQRGMAIELNTRFLYREHSDEERAKYVTAHRRLLAKCKANNVGVAVGSDAHSPKDQGRAFATVLPLLDECGINELVFPIAGRLAHVALRVERKAETPSVVAAVPAVSAADDRKALRKPRTSEAPARSKDSSSKRDESYASDESADDAAPMKAKPRPKRTKNRTAPPPEDADEATASNEAAAGGEDVLASNVGAAADNAVGDDEPSEALAAFAAPDVATEDVAAGDSMLANEGVSADLPFVGGGTDVGVAGAPADLPAANEAPNVADIYDASPVLSADAAAAEPLEPAEQLPFVEAASADLASTAVAPAESRPNDVEASAAGAIDVEAPVVDTADVAALAEDAIDADTSAVDVIGVEASAIDTADSAALAEDAIDGDAAAGDTIDIRVAVGDTIDIDAAAGSTIDIDAAAGDTVDVQVVGVDTVDLDVAPTGLASEAASEVEAANEGDEGTFVADEPAEDEAAMLELAASVPASADVPDEDDFGLYDKDENAGGQALFVEPVSVETTSEIVVEATLEPIVTAAPVAADGFDDAVDDLDEFESDAGALPIGPPADTLAVDSDDSDAGAQTPPDYVEAAVYEAAAVALASEPAADAPPRRTRPRPSAGRAKPSVKTKPPTAKSKPGAKKAAKPAVKAIAKKANANKTSAKKAALKSTASKKTVSKKAAVNKPAVRPSAAKKAGAKKTAAKKAGAKKPAPKRR